MTNLMKSISLIGSMKKQIVKPVIYLLAIGLFTLVSTNIIAQEEKASSEKAKAIMKLTYKKTNDELSLKVAAFTKVEGKNIPIEGSMVSLYLNETKPYDTKTGEGLLGRLPLDQDGKILFVLKDGVKELARGKHQFKLIAEMKDNPKYLDKQQEVEINDANITITISGKDTARIATAKLTEIKEDGTVVPIVGTEIKFGIKRTFSILPFGGDGLVTNENGEISAPIPNKIIGEADGTLIVTARIEENDTYGNVQSNKAIPWSVLPKPIVENKRNLWSTGRNAPYSLVIVSLSIIGVIWGLLIYLVTFLFKIKKMGKENSNKNK